MKNKTVGEKISKILEEQKYEVSSRDFVVLKIYNLTAKEYDRFIKFISDVAPNKKGYEAINILLNTYEEYQKLKSLDSYIKELEKKVVKNE